MFRISKFSVRPGVSSGLASSAFASLPAWLHGRQDAFAVNQPEEFAEKVVKICFKINYASVLVVSRKRGPLFAEQLIIESSLNKLLGLFVIFSADRLRGLRMPCASGQPQEF